MAAEARRLRAAIETSTVWGGSLPAGASVSQLSDLRAAFAPECLPDELLELLSVMNGTGDLWAMVAEIGPLLDCERIVAETALFRGLAEGAQGWCSAWTVISAEGWTHAAVLRRPAPIRSSPVIDLSFGNQDYPVQGAALTALVAASADAWEHGLHQDPDDFYAGWRPEAHALVRHAEELYPGDRGLRTQDAVCVQPAAWPRDWPDRHENPVLLPGPPKPLAQTDTLIPHEVVVDVIAREGRTVQVADKTGSAWIDVPPAFDPEAAMVPGTRHHLVVYPVSLLNPCDDLRATLRVQGAYDPT